MNQLPPLPLLALALCSLGLIFGGACGGSGESTSGFTGTGASSAGGSSTTGTGTGPATCGNGQPEPGKDCDPSIKGGAGPLGGLTCVLLGEGFSGGTLSCTADCEFDTSGCTKAVNCFNGTTTCSNPKCADQCADPCAPAALQAAPDPSMQSGDTTSHPSTLDSKCSSSAGTGPNVVYQVTAAVTGVLAIDLESGTDLDVSARTTCAQASTELACINHFVGGTFAQHLVVPCTAGQVFFVVVGGHGADDAGDFTLAVRSRPIVCGDDFTDPPEQCDDGNTVSGDGCSSTCQVESTETEPNNTVAEANAYVSPWYAQITPAGDVDVVSVQVASVPSGITAALADFDGHACEDGTMEAVLQILAPDGTTVLASEDAGLTDTCASVMATASQVGTYYVSVAASKLSASPTFPYKLDVTAAASMCGDGVVEPGEQCDPPSPPTCSATCQFIFSDHAPNCTCATANPFTGTAADPWYAQITPADDVNWVSFKVAAGTTGIDVYVDDNGDGDCPNDVIIAGAELVAPDCTTVIATNDGNGSTYCPSITATMGAGFTEGTYFVKVSAGPLGTGSTFDYRLRIETSP
jgi:cysteine-rich repeat protein